MKVKVPPCTIGRRHPKVLWSEMVDGHHYNHDDDHDDDHDNDVNDYEDDVVEELINLEKGDDSGHKKNGAEYVASGRVILPVW